MNRPPHVPTDLPEPTTHMAEGWHCLHLYYKVDQSSLNQLDRVNGAAELAKLLDPAGEIAPTRLQSFVVPGYRADFGLMAMDPDPLRIDALQQAIRASTLGPALVPTYSFVSITEVSEYVPSVEQFADRMKREGMDPSNPAFEARVNAYKDRLPMMNNQRLYPDFPAFPIICFYPMNKIRDPHANWYTLPFSERSSMMSEHATSGMKFAGRVSQLITASTGFDDWEWGVTLWGRAPEHIKEIVYSMRFDQASAKYAEFGSFYIGYIDSPDAVIKHLRLGS